MIVDDEKDILDKARLFLQDDDFNIITAKDSREALELLTNKEDLYDLVLIDTPLPCSNKTALFSMNPRSKLDTSGVEKFLEKPFSKEQLVKFVKEKV